MWISVWWPSLIIYTINAERAATEKWAWKFLSLVWVGKKGEDNSIQIKQTVIVYIHSFLLKRIYSNVDLTKQQYLHIEWEREKNSPQVVYTANIRKENTDKTFSLTLSIVVVVSLQFCFLRLLMKICTEEDIHPLNFLFLFVFLLLLVTSFPSSSFCTRRKK